MTPVFPYALPPTLGSRANACSVSYRALRALLKQLASLVLACSSSTAVVYQTVLLVLFQVFQIWSACLATLLFVCNAHLLLTPALSAPMDYSNSLAAVFWHVHLVIILLLL